MNTVILTSIVFVFLVSVVAGVFQVIGRYIYNYRVTDAKLQVLLFGKIRVYQIALSSISSVDEVSFKDTLMDILAFRLGNRMFGPGLRINRHAGVLRRILISPDNPKEFKSRIQSAKAGILLARSAE